MLAHIVSGTRSESAQGTERFELMLQERSNGFIECECRGDIGDALVELSADTLHEFGGVDNRLASHDNLRQNGSSVHCVKRDMEMKSFREELWFQTDERRAYINITPRIESAVTKSGIREGLVLVNAMHITASVYINDDEPGLIKDYDEFLEKLAPQGAAYRHHATGEDNGDAHIKRQLMGREVVVAITNGALDFGPWEQIFYAEFDGRRKKTRPHQNYWCLGHL